MGTILIKNSVLDGKRRDIFISGRKIERIEEKIDTVADTVIDAKGKWVIPGLFNMHTHASMTLFRGYQEDLPLQEWLQKIWVAEARLDEEAIYWGTRLACLEMIKSGTICFLDMYFKPSVSAEAVRDSGMKAALSYCFLDLGKEEGIANDRKYCEKVYGRTKDWDGDVKFAVSVHAPYTVSEENFRWAADFARERGLLLNVHLAETEKDILQYKEAHGCTSAHRLEELGFWGNDVIAAHSLWLDEDDIKILGRHGVTVVHNVNSNLKLASGYTFKYNELRDAGANVTIGTDGCGSSNNLDVLEAMKTSALLQKAWRRDSTALPLNELMDIATVNGAKALRVNSGKVEVGYDADLLLIDVHSPAFTPNLNFYSNLIYSANSSCVDTVICSGRVLMKGRRVDGEEEIMEMASKKCHDIIDGIK